MRRVRKRPWARVAAAAVLVLAAAAAAVTLLVPALLRVEEDVSCHYEGDPRGLSAYRVRAAPNGRNIFFHETSCHGSGPVLSARQACAVESAARAHPSHRVHVLFLARRAEERAGRLREGGAVDAEDAPLAALLGYSNVRLARVSLREYAAGSPLETWLATPALNSSRHRLAHTSDVLRYLTLWRHGGVYLDLDVVVARPLDLLADNWAGRESAHAVAAGALAFSLDPVGRLVASAALRELRATFDGGDWGNNGPGVITRVLQRYCGVADVARITRDSCPGFAVYPESYLYPVSWREWRRYLSPGEVAAVRNMSAFVFHVWNKHSVGVTLRATDRVPYTDLARRYCPRVFRAAGDYF